MSPDKYDANMSKAIEKNLWPEQYDITRTTTNVGVGVLIHGLYRVMSAACDGTSSTQVTKTGRRSFGL